MIQCLNCSEELVAGRCENPDCREWRHVSNIPYHPENPENKSTDGESGPLTDGGVDVEAAEDATYAFVTETGVRFHYRKDCRHIQQGRGDARRQRVDGIEDWEDDRCADCWPGMVASAYLGGVDGGMERVTTRIPEAQVGAAERLVERGIFPNRSAVIRSGLRRELEHHDATRVRSWRDR